MSDIVIKYLYGKEVASNEKVVSLADVNAIVDKMSEKIREKDAEIALLRGDQLPQRQDSVTAQLADLIPLANRLGCYDAADGIKMLVEQFKRIGVILPKPQPVKVSIEPEKTT